jgi:hypothetical protein
VCHKDRSPVLPSRTGVSQVFLGFLGSTFSVDWFMIYRLRQNDMFVHATSARCLKDPLLGRNLGSQNPGSTGWVFRMGILEDGMDGMSMIARESLN